jgi:hypothetical protein
MLMAGMTATGTLEYRKAVVGGVSGEARAEEAKALARVPGGGGETGVRPSRRLSDC